LAGRRSAQHPEPARKNFQLIYVHLPPAAILATELHLRAQTQIEQREQHLWFAGDRAPGGAMKDWLRAEQEVVMALCRALLRPGAHEPQSAPACQ